MGDARAALRCIALNSMTAMQMPQPGDKHRALEVMLGTWRATERMHPSHMSKDGTTVEGLVRNVRALDGFAIVQDYEQSRGGVVHFRGHGIFRYDEASKKYCLHWYDSMGHAPTLFEGTMDGGVLFLEHTGSHGSMRASWDFNTRNQITYFMDVAMGGQPWARFIDAQYQRVGG